MDIYSGYQRIKRLSIGKVVSACIVLVMLEGCQGCNRAAVSPDVENMLKSPKAPATVAPHLGGIPNLRGSIPNLGRGIPNLGGSISNLGRGIPNLGSTCYMNSVLQIIAKFYPDIFQGKPGDLATAGQVIVDKIKNDQGNVTREEAEEFYTAFLKTPGTRLTKGRQESADECMDIIWKHLNNPNVDDRLASPHITLSLKDHSANNNKKISMSQLLVDNASPNPDGTLNLNDEGRIHPENFLNNIVPIKLARNGTGIKLNTSVKDTSELAIKKTHIPALSKDLNCQLLGFIVHRGTSTMGGHYVTYTQQDGQWKLYNDARVEKVSTTEAEQEAEQAYLYFYRFTS